MTTHLIRAERITTADHIVTGGENNPLNQDGKRRAWKVCEVTVAARTVIRMVLVKPRGSEWVRDPAQSWITQSFDNKLKLRVLTR
jgi:hypothetical protein